MKLLSRLIFPLLLVMSVLHAEPWEDPAPPKFKELIQDAAPMPQSFDRLTFLQAPKPLSKEAKTTDWPRFLGPTDDAHSSETKLLHDWSKGGPAKLWEVKKGEGYTSPAIAGDYLVIFHALGGKEVIECLQPESGKRYWSFDYAIDYRDRYGYANGPRGSPVIAEGRVLMIGVTSMMTCLELKTGRLLWQRDLRKEFNVPQDFFGHGGSPLVMDGKAIVNVGGKETLVPDADDMQARAEALRKPGLCVGAFDLKTGKLVWGVKDSWGASYASPIAATLHGQQKVLVFAGGESNPATGGLLCLDPKDGTVHERFEWRAKDYISATASTPTLIPDKNRVFISTAYPKGRPLGGVMLEFDEHFKAKEVWSSKKLATHWMSPVYYEGHLYAIDGETERVAQLVCFDAEQGQEKWRKDIEWIEDELSSQNGGRPAKLGIQRASLLRLDGKFLVLGELGTLIWMDLTPSDAKIESRAQLFYAPHTWCLPALSRGLLFIMQNADEQVRGKTGERILSYDLREP
jgi:outer membrane protein assembly factor BamB